MISLQVNGQLHEVAVDPETPLLWVLRESLNLTGTKYFCGIGVCGACTIHIDDISEPACKVSVGAVRGRPVTTIEGLLADARHPLARAWIDHDVPQCGYCQPGMLMAAAALLVQNPHPSDADIDAAVTNICRCGTYNRIRQAIHQAAGS